MTDPNAPDPRRQGDPRPEDARVSPNAPYSDPAADPRIANPARMRSGGSRTGIIVAGIVAALLVIALIAFSSGPATDSGTTAVIPQQSETAPAPEAAPGEQPAAPLGEAPADNQ